MEDAFKKFPNEHKQDTENFGICPNGKFDNDENAVQTTALKIGLTEPNDFQNLRKKKKSLKSLCANPFR